MTGNQHESLQSRSVSTAASIDRRHLILLVESDDRLRQTISLQLKLSGFAIREARSGMEALGILDRWRPDLVILDVVLPGIDGRAVVAEIAGHPATRSLPVMVITAAETEVDGVHAACVMRKPLVMERLVSAVLDCLQRSAG